MRATFIGPRVSRGFVPGRTYNLSSFVDKDRGWIKVTDKDNPRNWCPYSKIETFLENWHIEYNRIV